MSYQPPNEILEKYAKVLVNFALNGGEGIKPGDVVRLSSRAAQNIFLKKPRQNN
jgi:hypothetical protein